MVDRCLDTCLPHYTRKSLECQQSVSVLQKHTHSVEGGPNPLEGLLTGAGEGVEVDALRQLGERLGIGLGAAGDELGHVIPAGELQGAGELAVDGVVHDESNTVQP